MTELTLVQAVNDGLRSIMREDDSVMILGEDVGPKGGVFLATEGSRKTSKIQVWRLRFSRARRRPAEPMWSSPTHRSPEKERKVVAVRVREARVRPLPR